MNPYEEYRKKVQKNMNASMFARDSYSQSILSNESLREIGAWRPYQSEYAFNPDLDTSQGLYKLAQQAGLGKEADRAIERAGGESMKYMSGGFIMDSMDVLNTLQYGVAGVIKGNGFIDGVKNRESFADDDALGKYGLGGKLAGFALDIATDPLTYVAPWKVLMRLPGFAATADLAKVSAFGELNVIKIAGQEMQWRSGGWSPLNFLADRLVYGHSVDRNFRRSFETLQASKENAFANADDLIGVFSKIDPTVSKQTLAFAPDGSMISKDLSELRGSMSAEDFTKVESMYKMRDQLMKDLVDEGVISEAAAKTHWNTYLKQSYDEFTLTKKADFKKKGFGIDNTSRVATKETRENLTFVEDAPAVWAGTLKKQLENLHNARINKMVANNFALDDAGRLKFVEEGGDVTQLVQVPQTPNYVVKGNEIDYKIALDGVSKSLKKIRKARSKVVGDEKGLVSEITSLEKQLASLKEGGEEKLSEALSGFKKTLREAGVYDGPRKKVPVGDGQNAVADALRRWMNRGSKTERLAREQYSTQQILDELFEVKDGIKYAKTKEGIVLQKAFDNPQMMFQWESPLEFLDAVRYPDKAKVFQEGVDRLDEISDKASDAAIKKAEKAARKIGKLAQTKDVLENTNLKLVRESMDRLEQDYADLLFKRQNILEALNENGRGQLAGKWMHKDTWALLKETTSPDRQVGEVLVQHFKKAKVIWNISSYPRNAMSAMVQNWWRLGMGPWKIGAYMDAVSELRNGGKYLEEMKAVGFSMRSGALGEVLSNYVNDMTLGKSVGGKFAKFKDKAKHVDRMLVNTYGHIDNVAKIAAYKYGREVRGWSPEKALEAAYEATYNYSQVTPFVHQMRRAIWGVPFITFNLKSVGLVTSTLKYAPGRISVFGKARNALFNAAGVEGEQEQESMPAWMRDDAFLLRLPWKDGEDRSMYFDLSYILPIGAIMSGEYLKNPIAANPVLQLVKELSQNQTFSGYKIFNESDDIDGVVADIFVHVSKLALPPVVEQQLPKGYDSKGNRVPGTMQKFATVDTQDRGANERSFYQEMFRLAGLNVTPYDLESREQSFDWTRKRNLETMLQENGILSQYTRPYLPEDSPVQPQPLYDTNARPIGR
jgi:hypothetical protein